MHLYLSCHLQECDTNLHLYSQSFKFAYFVWWKFLICHLLWFFCFTKPHINSINNHSQKQYILKRDHFISKSPLFACRFTEHKALFTAINKSWQTDRPAMCGSVFCWCVCSLSCSVICCYPETLRVFDIVPHGALFRPSLAPGGAAQRLGQACDCRPLWCWEWGACLPPITHSPAPWNAGLYSSYPIWTPGNRGQGE